MRKPWFVVKTYGLGLSPAWPEGWIALVAYIALLSLTPVLTLALGAPVWVMVGLQLLLTAALVALALATSDRRPWRWRWGGR